MSALLPILVVLVPLLAAGVAVAVMPRAPGWLWCGAALGVGMAAAALVWWVVGGSYLLVPLMFVCVAIAVVMVVAVPVGLERGGRRRTAARAAMALVGALAGLLLVGGILALVCQIAGLPWMAGGVVGLPTAAFASFNGWRWAELPAPPPRWLPGSGASTASATPAAPVRAGRSRAGGSNHGGTRRSRTRNRR
jgi:hypothetical protein